MHRQELPHFVGTRLVDAKTHQHPANDHRGTHGHHHELVGHAIHHRDLAALGLLRQARHHLPQRGRELLHAVGQADRAQLQVRSEQRSHGCADAAAMVLQHRLDGFLVPRVDRRAKAIVSREQGRSLAQLLGILVEQAAPDVFVQVQGPRDLGAGIAVDGGPHHGKPCRLHDEQQQQRQPHQPQDQAAPGQAQPLQGCNPVMRTDAVAEPVAGTVSACSRAGAPTGRRVCQVRSV